MQFNGTPLGGEIPDETLVKAFRAGDREAFAVIYRRYVGMVTGYVYKRRPSMACEQREDLVQEIFTEALALLDNERAGYREADFESFRHWLFSIAKGVMLVDGKRFWTDRQRYFRSVDELSRELRDGAPVAARQTAELPALLQAGIEKLDERHRRVLELLYIEGLPIDAAARVLDLSRSLVDELAVRGLARLREVCSGSAEDDEPRSVRRRQIRARKPVTMADVAARCGVTKITVSRALSAPERVAPETLARIQAAADELGYRRDAKAEPPTQERAALARELIDEAGPRGLTRSEVSRLLNGKMSAADLDAFMAELSDSGQYERYQVPPVGRGRPSARIRRVGTAGPRSALLRCASSANGDALATVGGAQ